MVGGALAVVCVGIAAVQVAASVRRSELRRFLPPALAASAVGVLAGLFLLLGAEFRWVSGSLLDDAALPLAIAALWWVFHNRIGSKRNRAIAQ